MYLIQYVRDQWAVCYGVAHSRSVVPPMILTLHHDRESADRQLRVFVGLFGNWLPSNGVLNEAILQKGASDAG